MGSRILLVDDDPAILAALERQVSAAGHAAVCAQGASAAIALLERESFDLCLVDVRLVGGTGPDVLAAARRLRPPLPIVVLVGTGAVKDAVAALRAGATDFLAKPVHPDLLTDAVKRVLGSERASNDGARVSDGATVLGEHPTVRLMLERIGQVADTEANVLIRGEGGTGAEVVARLIHASSSRRAAPLMVARLSGLDEGAAQAELFGGPGRAGKLWASQHGTLFLEEVAELPREVQARLARVLQDREFLIPGADRPVTLNVRVIASTGRNLEALVREGTFREDLYYRLDVIPIDVPALRTRHEDIPFLADHFRREVNARDGHAVPAFGPDVVKRLCAYDWPGNVRQLESVVEKLVQTVGDRAVALDDLPQTLRSDVEDLGVGIVDLPPYGVDLRLLLTRLEDRLIGQALERTGGNKNRAAELLGMNRTTLVEKLRRRNVA